MKKWQICWWSNSFFFVSFFVCAQKHDCKNDTQDNIAPGLDFAVEKNVALCDIKPANILVEQLPVELTENGDYGYYISDPWIAHKAKLTQTQGDTETVKKFHWSQKDLFKVQKGEGVGKQI